MGLISAASVAPPIAHRSHAGKFAPAILTIGSHPESAISIIASKLIGFDTIDLSCMATIVPA
jgi:hypothetical protein